MMRSKILTILGSHRAIQTLSTILLLGVVASIISIWRSPADYLQGWYVLILYIHVPCSWIALALYAAIALLSLTFLITKEPMLDIVARTAAPIGICYTMISLITGSLWGRPTWGTFWVWDARLTSMLMQLFIYLIYMALQSNKYQADIHRANICAYFAIVTLINVPIIKFSVYMWNTLHQQSSVITLSGPKLDAAMLTPLLINFFTLCCFALLVIIIGVRTAILKKKLWRLNAKKGYNY